MGTLQTRKLIWHEYIANAFENCYAFYNLLRLVYSDRIQLYFNINSC